MQLHDLKPPKGSRTKRQRIGRGTGSGRGKTSGRGQKGQNARSEGFRLGFEGGQMPLAQRLPKLPGFKNPFKKIYTVVNISKLRRFEDGATVDAEVLVEAGLVRSGVDVKVLGTGDLKRRLTVEAHSFSSSARAAIEAGGGSVKVLGEPRKIGPRRLAAKTGKGLKVGAQAPEVAAAEAPAKAEKAGKAPREKGQEKRQEKAPRPERRTEAPASEESGEPEV
jgi:large subunit ribosomal protein L15